MDFTLVILSWFGSILVIGTQENHSIDFGAEARLVRLARVFFVMRLLRLFRLLEFLRLIKSKLLRIDFSVEVARHMQTITVLTCFIHGHIASQKEILRYFGTEGKVDIAELARCVIDSQVQTIRAIALAVDSVVQLDEAILSDLNSQKRSKVLAEKLDHLVLDAHRHNVVTCREAESILIPVRAHLKNMQSRIREMHFGYYRSSTFHAPDLERLPSRLSEEGYDSEDRGSVLMHSVKSDESQPPNVHGNLAVLPNNVPSGFSDNTVAQSAESGSSQSNSVVTGRIASTNSEHIGCNSSSSNDIFVAAASGEEPVAIGKDHSEEAPFLSVVPGSAAFDPGNDLQ